MGTPIASAEVRSRCVDGAVDRLRPLLHRCADVLEDQQHLATLYGTMIRLAELVAGQSFDGEITITVRPQKVQCRVSSQVLDLGAAYADIVTDASR